MKQTSLPSLMDNAAFADVVFEEPCFDTTRTYEQKTLELACVDLICKLENLFAKANEQNKVKFMDDAATTVQSMLVAVLDFSEEFFSGNAETQSRAEIGKAFTATKVYEEMTKSRSLGRSILRTFWRIGEGDEINAAYAQMVSSLIRVFGCTFYHAIMLLGPESAIGKQIDQSAIVFAEEIKQSW